MEALFESNLKSLELLARGKVRDIYRVDAKRLLILATDRMSAFDVVLPDPIPGKGQGCEPSAGFCASTARWRAASRAGQLRTGRPNMRTSPAVGMMPPAIA